MDGGLVGVREIGHTWCRVAESISWCRGRSSRWASRLQPWLSTFSSLHDRLVEDTRLSRFIGRNRLRPVIQWEMARCGRCRRKFRRPCDARYTWKLIQHAHHQNHLHDDCNHRAPFRRHSELKYVAGHCSVNWFVCSVIYSRITCRCHIPGTPPGHDDLSCICGCVFCLCVTDWSVEFVCAVGYGVIK